METELLTKVDPGTSPVEPVVQPQPIVQNPENNEEIDNEEVLRTKRLEETIEGLTSTITNLSSTIKTMEKKMEQLNERYNDEIEKIREEMPHKSMPSNKVEGFYDYDRINKQYINELAESRKEVAFERLDKLVQIR